jgi:hypothetical protein
VLLLAVLPFLVRSETVLFHLKGGDRLAGTVLSESSNAVVIVTRWASEVSLPADQIEAREVLPDPTATNNIAATVVAPTNESPASPAAPANELAKPAKPRAKQWWADAKVGVDLIRGAKDREIYYGQFALRYARPYATKPRESFRNTLEYRVDYSQTDGVESSDRMYGSDKVDLDIGRDLFVYNFAGAGYDDVRRIEFQYEVGPGFGVHVLRRTNLVVNIEGGLNYQSQERIGAERVEALYGRVAQDVMWRLDSAVTLSQRAALLTRLDEPEQMQLRVEATFGVAIMKNVSFNLTAIEIYDTRPVPGVSPNEFQLRSAIGLAF